MSDSKMLEYNKRRAQQAERQFLENNQHFIVLQYGCIVNCEWNFKHVSISPHLVVAQV